MAFSYNNWDKLSREGNENVRKIFAYTDTTVTLATLEASAYFNTVAGLLTIGDRILLRGSDGSDTVDVTAVSPNVTVALGGDDIPAGTIVNSMINASAGISWSKMATMGGAEIIIASAGGVPTPQLITGDVTLSSAGVVAIAAGAIVDADVNASAAIAYSKLAALGDGSILIGSGASVATEQSISGAISLANTGVTTLQPQVVASSNLDPTLVQYTTGVWPASEMIGAYATPIELIAAPGAGFYITVHRAMVVLDYGTTQFTGGGATAFQYDSTANGAGVHATGTVAAAKYNAATADSVFEYGPANDVSGALSAIENKKIYFSNDTGAFADGDSTFSVFIWYSVTPIAAA